MTSICVIRSRESLTRMRDAYPQRSYPPEGELEQILYEAAKTEAEFSSKGDFDERLQRAIGLTVLRSHAQARPPSLPRSGIHLMGLNLGHTQYLASETTLKPSAPLLLSLHSQCAGNPIAFQEWDIPFWSLW